MRRNTFERSIANTCPSGPTSRCERDRIEADAGVDLGDHRAGGHEASQDVDLGLQVFAVVLDRPRERMRRRQVLHHAVAGATGPRQSSRLRWIVAGRLGAGHVGVAIAEGDRRIALGPSHVPATMAISADLSRSTTSCHWSGSTLAKQAHRRIPGAVVAAFHPSPVGRVRQQHPYRLAERACEMGDRSVDGHHAGPGSRSRPPYRRTRRVRAPDRRRRASNGASLPARRSGPLLQGEPARAVDLDQRRTASRAISSAGDRAHASGRLPRPVRPSGRDSPQVDRATRADCPARAGRERCGNRVQRRSEDARKTQKVGVEIEVRESAHPAECPVDPGERARPAPRSRGAARAAPWRPGPSPAARSERTGRRRRRPARSAAESSSRAGPGRSMRAGRSVRAATSAAPRASGTRTGPSPRRTVPRSAMRARNARGASARMRRKRMFVVLDRLVRPAEEAQHDASSSGPRCPRPS